MESAQRCSITAETLWIKKNLCTVSGISCQEAWDYCLVLKLLENCGERRQRDNISDCCYFNNNNKKNLASPVFFFFPPGMMLQLWGLDHRWLQTSCKRSSEALMRPGGAAECAVLILLVSSPHNLLPHKYTHMPTSTSHPVPHSSVAAQTLFQLITRQFPSRAAACEALPRPD